MFVNLVNSDKSGIVASIDSSVKLAKTKDRDSTSYNRVTNFLQTVSKRLSSEKMNFGRCVQNRRRS